MTVKGIKEEYNELNSFLAIPSDVVNSGPVTRGEHFELEITNLHHFLAMQP